MRRCSDTMDCAICLGRPVHCEWTEPYAWAGPFTLPRLTRSADLGVVVVGLVVYLLLSRSGPLGFLGWLFSFKAMVLAQTVLVLPVVTALTRQTVQDADTLHGEQLRSLGAGTGIRSLLLAWDERYALLMVVIAAFGRAISEVGAVMIVGGNIDGFTRVMTTAIALETSKGDLPLALGLGLVLLVLVLILNTAVSLLRSWRERVDGASGQGALHAGTAGAGLV